MALQGALPLRTVCLLPCASCVRVTHLAMWIVQVTAEGDVMKLGAGRQVVGTAWLIEHVIFIFALAIWAFIPQWPGWFSWVSLGVG